MRSFKPFTALIVLMMLASSTYSQDLWYDSYESGIRAYQAGNWAQAEAKFKAALKAQASQGKRIKTYGTRFIRYIPDYYLGMVYARTGRYEEALRQFAKVTDSKLLEPGDSEYQELLAETRQAEEKLNPPPPKEEKAQKTAQDEARALEEQARTLMDRGQFQEARTVLKAAAEKDPANEAIAALAAQIAEKETEFQARQEADRKREDQQRLAQQFNLLLRQAGLALADGNYALARELARKASGLGVDDQAVREISERIESAEKNRKTPSAVPPPRPELNPAEAREEEKQALVAFYSGDYQRSILLLEHLASRTTLSARMYFYLGCSHAATGLLQGKNGQAALQKSREMFARSRALDPAAHFDIRYISPRILALYNRP